MKQFYFIFIVCIAQVQLEAMQSVKQLFGKAQIFSSKTKKTILTNIQASFPDTSHQSSKSVSVFRKSLPIAAVTLGLSYVYYAREGEVSRKSLSASSLYERDEDRMITNNPTSEAGVESAQKKLDFDLGTAIYNSDYESALKLLGQGAHPNALYAPLENKPLLWVAIDIAESAIKYPNPNSWRIIELLLEKGARVEDKQWGSALDHPFKTYKRLVPLYNDYARRSCPIDFLYDYDSSNDVNYAETIVGFLFGTVTRALPYASEEKQMSTFKKLLSLSDESLSYHIDKSCAQMSQLFVEKAFDIDIDIFEEAITNNRMGSVKELLKHPKLDLSSLSSEVLQKADVAIQQCVYKELIERNIQLAVPVPSFFQLDPY